MAAAVAPAMTAAAAAVALAAAAALILAAAAAVAVITVGIPVLELPAQTVVDLLMQAPIKIILPAPIMPAGKSPSSASVQLLFRLQSTLHNLSAQTVHKAVSALTSPVTIMVILPGSNMRSYRAMHFPVHQHSPASPPTRSTSRVASARKELPAAPPTRFVFD